MKNKVFLIAFIAVIAVVIGCLTVGVILRGDRKEPPVQSDFPIEDPTDIPATDTKPNIAPIVNDDPIPSAKKGELDFDLNEQEREDSAIVISGDVEYGTKEMPGDEE